MLNNIYNLLFYNLFTLKGRSSRREYIIKVILLTTCMITGSYTINLFGNETTFFSFCYILTLCIITTLMSLQYFPLAVRRLHDLNESGWYVLLTFAPFGQLLILWLMFKKGTPGINRYGEPPIN